MDRVPCLLQQFARLPIAGKVKTRLQPYLSADEACDVHVTLMEQTMACLQGCALGPVELWLDQEGSHPAVTTMIAGGADGPFLQGSGDLGERMYGALRAGLERADKVVLVGSDCPELDRDYLKAAFEALDGHDIVLGPAEDGGYVLIGARQVRRGMFQGVPWGGDGVRARTQESAGAQGLRIELLDERYDVDRPEDLRRWRGSR